MGVSNTLFCRNKIHKERVFRIFSFETKKGEFFFLTHTRFHGIVYLLGTKEGA